MKTVLKRLLRHYFAASALQGLIAAKANTSTTITTANGQTNHQITWDIPAAAKTAYEYADAMLKAGGT